MEFSHIPVLLQPCLDGLNIDPAGIYLDGTAGGAGHSREIAKRLTTGRLISLDQDPDAVAVATERLKGLPAQVVQVNFREAARVLAELGIPAVNGALLDLGVSSHQLDDAARGFSYHADAPLDMRMSQQGPTAADLVNTLDREELTRILRDYGEEPYAWQIAGKIVAARAEQPILTTLQLAEIAYNNYFFSNTITNALLASYSPMPPPANTSNDFTSFNAFRILPSVSISGQAIIVLATPGKEIDLALLVLVSKPPLIRLHPALP